MTATSAADPHTILIVDDTPANLGVMWKVLRTTAFGSSWRRTAKKGCNAPTLYSRI